MISRSSLGRSAQRALRRQCCAKPANRRGFAASASGSFQYQTGDASGIKFASRDLAGPTTTLALVSKAGTRYQFLPGLAAGLEKFAYRGTEKRSTLRIQRESELLGSELNAYHTRESLVLESKFMRDDLPYFVELLAEVVTQTRYAPHVLNEEVLPSIGLNYRKHLVNPKAVALDSAHGVAFHRGLGTLLDPAPSSFKSYLDVETIQAYASAAYAKPNFALVANGADHAELSKWIGEFFGDASSAAPADLPKLETPPTKYYGGEERIAHGSGNAVVIAFPGSSSSTGGLYKPEIAVLTTLLGGETSIKWSPGFSLLSKAVAPHSSVSVSTQSAAYSDAGLLCVTLQGPAKGVAAAAVDAVKVIKSVAAGEISNDDFTKSKAQAKFKVLEYGQNFQAGLEPTGSSLVSGGQAYQLDEIAKATDAVTLDQVKQAAKTLLDAKATVSSVGDLFQLPFAEEIGLNV